MSRPGWDICQVRPGPGQPMMAVPGDESLWRSEKNREVGRTHGTDQTGHPPPLWSPASGQTRRVSSRQVGRGSRHGALGRAATLGQSETPRTERRERRTILPQSTDEEREGLPRTPFPFFLSPAQRAAAGLHARRYRSRKSRPAVTGPPRATHGVLPAPVGGTRRIRVHHPHAAVVKRARPTRLPPRSNGQVPDRSSG